MSVMGEPAAWSAPAEAEVVERFGDLKYSRLISGASGALVELGEAARHVAVVDTGDLTACVLVPVNSGEQRVLVSAGQRTARAKLAEAGYVVQVVRVTPEVLEEVFRNPGQAASAEGQGEPIALFRRWVSRAIAMGGSDLHIEVGALRAEVRVRVDNELVPLDDGADGIYSRAAAHDAVAAGYNTTRLGASSSDYDGKKYRDCIIRHADSAAGDCELRYQSIPGRYGPKVIIRIQRQSDRGHHGSFETAGYEISQRRLWDRAARAGKGLVVVTGAVNSGKSASLATFIETFPNRERRGIYTVEDPIEREIAGAHQLEVLRDPANPEATAERYQAAIRALLRGDLDLVMLGEVRDWLTANFFLQVGQTGHLAMGTLHCHFLSSIVPRLTNERMGLSREELTAPKVLNLLVYQSLLPRLCERCRRPAAEVAAQDEDLGRSLGILGRLGLDQGRFFVKGAGCAACSGRGTRGRVLVAEMFQPDRRWLQLTRSGDDEAAESHYRSLSDGDLTSSEMTGKTVFEHALLRAWRGEIDLRDCEEFEAFDRYEVLK